MKLMTQPQQLPLQRATLPQFLARAVPYEQWRAPLDPKLRTLTWLAGTALLAHLLFLMVLPWLLRATSSGFFLVFGGTLRALLSWIAGHTLILLALNIVALVAYLWLAWRTHGLKAGKLNWHHLAFGEVAAGAAGAFPLMVSLTLTLLNLILWILIISIGLYFTGCLIAAIFDTL